MFERRAALQGPNLGKGPLLGINSGQRAAGSEPSFPPSRLTAPECRGPRRVSLPTASAATRTCELSPLDPCLGKLPAPALVVTENFSFFALVCD